MAVIPDMQLSFKWYFCYIQLLMYSWTQHIIKMRSPSMQCLDSCSTSFSLAIVNVKMQKRYAFIRTFVVHNYLYDPRFVSLTILS